nr:Beta-lactamase-related domain containing protein [Haemonchus contortus]
MENRLLPMPSNMGIGNARSLAHFHSLITEGKLLSGAFNKNFERPVLENEFDHVIGYEENKGYGFQFTKNPKGQWIFGHSGFGGQNVRVDLHNGLSYAYLCSGLKISDADLVESEKLGPYGKLQFFVLHVEFK